MKKTIAGVVLAGALAFPSAAFADDGQLIALYTQLIQLLKQEIALLQSQTLVISPSSGQAPFTTSFTVRNPNGTESIDFGDGHSTGSSGCIANARGFCDLSTPVSHTYQFPGNYTVTLYRGADPGATVVTTLTVSVK